MRGDPDFSALEFVFLGGYSISSETKERVNRYLKKCGASIRAANGYGISEAGGACIVASPDREDDAIGYPLPGVKVKIYDEEEDTFYNVEDGPRTGVLFISSDSVSSGIIDDVTFFHTDEIDGERYLNTYDLVRVNEDQSLTCVGRMNKYFVNNEGIRFDAGLIETAVSAEPRVASCGLAPEYFKSIHDTVAVLYVEPVGDPAHYREYVRQALLNVFVRDQKFKETELPSQCVITENIPYNASGKVDTHQIMAGGVEGRRYIIKAIRQNGDLTDIRLLPAERQIYNVSDGIPEELRNKEYERFMRLLKGFDVRSRRDAFMSRRNEAPGLCGIFDEMMSRMFAMYDRRAPYRRPFDDEENWRACSRCRNRRFDLDDEDEDDDFSDDHDPDFNENLYDSDEDEYDDDRSDYISGRRRDRRLRMRRLMEQLVPILFDATVYDRFYED